MIKRVQFKINTKQVDDRVEVKSHNDGTMFVVRSPLGISNASIERTTERWPDTIAIQMRLKGLESFKLSNGKIKLEASVSSHDGSMRLWKVGQEDSPLDSKGPYRMEIQQVGEDRFLSKLNIYRVPNNCPQGITQG